MTMYPWRQFHFLHDELWMMYAKMGCHQVGLQISI
jgi:hypothetical protein